MTNIITYEDPLEDGSFRVVRLTEEEAIKQSKEYAAHKGYSYESDAEALMDFIVTHWANIESIEGVIEDGEETEK
jgi:hypothetical protein